MNEERKSAIKNILQSPQWKFCEAEAEKMIEEIKDESCLRNTLWSTAKDTVFKEGQVQGIRRFFRKLNDLANE